MAMRLTETITSNVFMVTWAVLTSFFWFRGVWRDNARDRLLAGMVFLLLAVLAVAADGTTYPLNTAGGFVAIAGVLTMLIGPLGKRMPFRRAADYGVVCIILGVLLVMLL
jgi:mannitol-specific phosphotransferase system IIBC component